MILDVEGYATHTQKNNFIGRHMGTPLIAFVSFVSVSFVSECVLLYHESVPCWCDNSVSTL